MITHGFIGDCACSDDVLVLEEGRRWSLLPADSICAEEVEEVTTLGLAAVGRGEGDLDWPDLVIHKNVDVVV